MVETALPGRTRHYEHMVWDTARWDAYVPRDGDIIISTAYRAGTTWTQNICALLIFQTPDFPERISTLSAWWDQLSEPVEQVAARYDAQAHRRFIKTHAPLDGIPYFPEVTYLFCARDPRDVFMSTLAFLKNGNPEAEADFVKKNREARAAMPEFPDDPDVRFGMWLTMSSLPGEQDGFPFWSMFNHAATFWHYRHAPNIHFLHYSDLKADLDGEMRRLAETLGIDVPEERWPALVEAASFEHMRANADRSAPDTHHKMWIENKNFFNSGTSGQWRGVLSDESLAKFDHVLAERVEPDLGRWLLEGMLAGNPKEL